MNGWSLNEIARAAAQNPFLARLVLVSLELVVLAAAVAVLIRMLRLTTPRLCALLWLVVLAKPILGLVIGTPVPLLRLDTTPTVASAVNHQAALAKILEESTKSDIVVKPNTSVSAPASAVQSNSSATVPVAMNHENQPVKTIWSSVTPIGVMEYAWLAIVLGLSAYLIFDMRRLGSLLRHAAAPSPELQRVFDKVARELGLSKAPALLVSDALDSPALAGILRPVVLLPDWIAEQARPEQLAWLLRHELMHYKMRDPLGLAVRRLAEILFFFHPAVWLAGRKWEESMELACDRALLSTNDDARNYAEQLYWVLEHRANRQRLLRAGLYATRTQIGKRIASLLSNPIRFSSRINAAALSGLVIVALIGLTIGFGFHEPAKAASSRQRGSTSMSATVSAAPKVIWRGGSLTPFDEFAGAAPEIKPKLKQMRSDLYWVIAAIEVYVQHNSALPETLDQLLAPYTKLEKIPEDVFAPRKPVSYRLSADKMEAVVYSVGPDGKDDGGDPKSLLQELPSTMPPIDTPKPGAIPEGDIIEKFNLKLYLERMESNRKHFEAYTKALDEIKQTSGRDNAMIHYVAAGNKMGAIIGGLGQSSVESDLLISTLENGWTEKSRPLLITIARFEPSFEEIRKGAALDYAVNTIGDGGPFNPVPNFLTPQTMTRILCLEGRWYESQDQPEKALDDYLTALTMGRDYSAPKASIISGLISVATQSTALKQITRFVSEPSTSRELVKRAAKRLQTIEATQGTLMDGIDSEFKCWQFFIDLARKDPQQLREKYADVFKQTGLPGGAEEFIKNVDQLDNDHRRLFEWFNTMSQTPYWERAGKGFDKAGYEKVVAELHPYIAKQAPNFLEMNTRWKVMSALMVEARITAAVELYKRDKGSCPADLNALTPGFIEVVPIDPFSGKPFPYERNGDTYRLWSVGPDSSSDNAAGINYDPTNGTISPGDIGPMR